MIQLIKRFSSEWRMYVSITLIEEKILMSWSCSSLVSTTILLKDLVGVTLIPLRTVNEINSMPFHFDSTKNKYSYVDQDFADLGLKFWDEDLPLNTSSPWNIVYNFRSGQGFMAQVFPPKDFNRKKYCNDRVKDLGTSFFDTNPNANFTYLFQVSA